MAKASAKPVAQTISVYVDGNEWKASVEMPAEISMDENGMPFVNATAFTKTEAVSEVVQKLTDIVVHALNQINALTKAPR